ncbi:MAG: YggT family protein [Flavobacteriales bacterium]|jgi:YggT family protein
MNALIKMSLYLVDTIGFIFLLLVILRFLLQLSRADFYNPVSQTIVKMTNPLLIPLRKVIPGLMGIDLASIVLAFIVKVATIEILFLLDQGNILMPLGVGLEALRYILITSCYIAYGCIFVVMISSFVAPGSQHPIIMLCTQILAPLSRKIQTFVPQTGGFDFSLMFIAIGVSAFKIFLDELHITLTPMGF